MDSVISDFEERATQIDEYFNFVKRTTHLRSFSNSISSIQVSATVFNILKANLFLLLYNLIESSFKNSLEKICIQITSEEILYKNVVPEIKKIWIAKKYKNFEKMTIPKDMKKSEFIMNIINSITEDIIEIKFYTDEKKRKNDDISGNLDAREIREINKKYGVELPSEISINTKSLLQVKTQRNNLAHGDETFSGCGRDYPLEKMEEIKNDSIEYMRFILTHIQNFIESKQYKGNSK